MSFLSILLGLLKFIGFIILLIMLIFCIIIFSPINYKVYIAKSEDIIADIKIRWLFNIIAFNYNINNKKHNNVLKIFNIAIGDTAKNKNKQNKTDSKDIDNNSKTETKKENAVEDDVIKEDDSKDNSEDENPDDESFNFDQYKKTYKKVINKAKSSEGGFKYFLNYPDKDLIIKLVIRLIKKLFIALKPKKFRLAAEIGLDEPDKVGYILGITQIIIAFTQLDIKLKGIFDKKVLNGDVNIEGSIYIYKLIIPLLQFILAKPILKEIKKIIF